MKTQRTFPALLLSLIWSAIALGDLAKLLPAGAAVIRSQDGPTKFIFSKKTPSGWDWATAALSSLCAVLTWILFFLGKAPDEATEAE
ncbi:MAG: hypothetical protein LBT60_01425 [Oscillospiraceae bacterium]|jgi:hypothetical protein|nr:hypothetical protein [Oscillospiraceae bacterium]